MISIPQPLAVVQFEPHPINYSAFDRVTGVHEMEIGGAKLRFVGLKDIPDSEVHLVQRGELVGKIINIS